MLRRLVALLIMPLLAAGGVFFVTSGFEKIQELRRIERIPRVPVDALIQGEANVSGRVDAYMGQLIQAPDSKAWCVYYHYTVEKRTRDSDGDVKWETIRSERKFIPFLLTDESGSVIVDPIAGGRVSLKSRHSRTEGDLRYTENRIDPGMDVFAMGLASRGADGMVLKFEGPGVYVPILSVRGEAVERGSVGLGSLILTGIGLLLLTLAMFALTRLLGIHMTLAYLLLSGLTVAVTLTVQSSRMIRGDLKSAFERLEKENAIRTEEVRRFLLSRRIAWNGEWSALETVVGDPSLDRDIAPRVSLHRVNLMRAVERAERIRRGFPERWIASGMGLPEPVVFTLTASEQARLDELEAMFVPSRISGLAGGMLGGSGLLGALLLGGLALRRIRLKRWIENIPTVSTQGVVYGLNEIKGTVAFPDDRKPLAGPLSGKACSCYRYTVKERRRNGKKTEWVTITDRQERIRFLCRDKDGDLEIDPDGAELIMKSRTRKREGRLRHEEYCLPLETAFYALGSAVIDPDSHDRLLMAKGDDQTLPFLVSDFGEGELVARKASAGFLLLAFGLNAFSLAGLSLAGWRGGFGVVQYQTAALLPLLYMILFFLGVLYNDLVFLRQRCDAMWSNIDVALKKRFDLLPSLVAAAKAYLEHEQTLQQALAACRTGSSTLVPGDAAGMESAAAAAVTAILGRVEDYPDLKADQTVQDLMLRMRMLEDEIGLMREGYNHAVEIYNNRLHQIPDILLAKLFKFSGRSFFGPELASSTG